MAKKVRVQVGEKRYNTQPRAGFKSICMQKPSQCIITGAFVHSGAECGLRLTFGELCASTCAQYTDATDRARQEGFRVGGVGLGGWIRGGGGGEQTKRGRGEERSGVAVRGEEGTGRGEPLCRFISCESAC